MGACEYTISVDGAGNAEAVEGCVDVFELAGHLAVHDHALIVSVEDHIAQVGADELLVVSITIVV